MRPGEVSRSHCGVLFLDEFPLFRTDVIDALRQPLESGEVTIARGEESATFPARGMVVMACNPCPCGEYTAARAVQPLHVHPAAATPLLTQGHRPGARPDRHPAARAAAGQRGRTAPGRAPRELCRRCVSGSLPLANAKRSGTPVASGASTPRCPAPSSRGSGRCRMPGRRGWNARSSTGTSAGEARCGSTAWPGRWPTCAGGTVPTVSDLDTAFRLRQGEPLLQETVVRRASMSDDDRLARVALSRLTEPGDPEIASLVAQLGAVTLRELLSDQAQATPEARDVASRLRGVDPAADLETGEQAGLPLRRPRRRRVAEPGRRPDAGRAARSSRRSAARAVGARARPGSTS